MASGTSSCRTQACSAPNQSHTIAERLSSHFPTTGPAPTKILGIGSLIHQQPASSQGRPRLRHALGVLTIPVRIASCRGCPPARAVMHRNPSGPPIHFKLKPTTSVCTRCFRSPSGIPPSTRPRALNLLRSFL